MRLTGGTSDVGRDDIGRVPVQAPAGALWRIVVRGSAWEAAACTSRSGTPASGGGDECVPERVRSDRLGDPGTARQRADDPPGAMPAQPAPVSGEEDRAVAAFTGGQVDRPGGARRQRDGDNLAALAGDRQRPVATLQAQVLDVSAGGLPRPAARSAREARSAHARVAARARPPPAGQWSSGTSRAG